MYGRIITTIYIATTHCIMQRMIQSNGFPKSGVTLRTVSRCNDYTVVIAEIEQLMIEGMNEVTPDMKIRVESAVSTCWSKQTKKAYDEHGNLVAWSLEDVASNRSTNTTPNRKPDQHAS